jgi:regulatory protein
MTDRNNPGDRVAMTAPPPSAHSLALAMLTRRAMTAAELRAALIKKGIAREEALEEVERLARAGLLDDASVAEAHVRARLRGLPASPRALRRQLAKRGVREDVVAATLAAATEQASEEQLAARALERLLARRRDADLRDPATRRRVAAAMQRRGFSAHAIAQALRAHR